MSNNIYNLEQSIKDFFKSYKDDFVKDPFFKVNNSGKLNPFYGKKHSIITKKHLSKVHTGKKHTEQHKLNIGNSLAKKYMITTPSGKTFKIKNLNKFAKNNSLMTCHLTRVAQGIRKHHKGYIAKYV
jgi:hypothetical protein